MAQTYLAEEPTAHPGCVHQLLVCQGAPPLTAVDLLDVQDVSQAYAGAVVLLVADVVLVMAGEVPSHGPGALLQLTEALPVHQEVLHCLAWPLEAQKHLEVEEQAANVDVLVDVEGALSGDPECERVQPHVQYLAAVMEVLHVVLEVHGIQKTVDQLQVALTVAAFGQAVESQAHVPRVTIPTQESY